MLLGSPTDGGTGARLAQAGDVSCQRRTLALDPLGEASCGLHPPPRLLLLLTREPHSFWNAGPQQGAPATSPALVAAHVLGCWACLGFLFPIDRLQMKPASTGGKHFISILTSLDDGERQFAGLCRGRPRLSLVL